MNILNQLQRLFRHRSERPEPPKEGPLYGPPTNLNEDEMTFSKKLPAGVNYGGSETSPPQTGFDVGNFDSPQRSKDGSEAR